VSAFRDDARDIGLVCENHKRQQNFKIHQAAAFG
jgi:hypothetical protein